MVKEKNKDRSSPVPTEHRESEQSINQSTETRDQNSKSKLWLVIGLVVVFLLIILYVTGVLHF